MRTKFGIVLITLGTVLLAAALSLFVYNQWEDWRAGARVVSIEEALKFQEDTVSHPSYDGTWVPSVDTGSSAPEDGTMPTLEVEGYEYIGTLSIPRFGLELPVMSEWSYPGLKIAPGRYSGSVRTGDLVICGHNYERHFRYLRNLEPGDPITFTDVRGNVFAYEVAETEILQPTAIGEMLDEHWDLTLFTCTIGGQARVTVRCMSAAS